MSRPSYRELNKKIKQARDAVLSNRVYVINPASVAADALELGYLVKDISEILADMLKEITPRVYVGQYPPQRAYEGDILDSELFAFKWESKRFGGEIYLKFALKKDRMWLVSLHQDRQGTGGE